MGEKDDAIYCLCCNKCFKPKRKNQRFCKQSCRRSYYNKKSSASLRSSSGIIAMMKKNDKILDVLMGGKECEIFAFSDLEILGIKELSPGIIDNEIAVRLLNPKLPGKYGSFSHKYVYFRIGQRTCISLCKN